MEIRIFGRAIKILANDYLLNNGSCIQLVAHDHRKLYHRRGRLHAFDNNTHIIIPAKLFKGKAIFSKNKVYPELWETHPGQTEGILISTFKITQKWLDKNSPT